LKKQNFTWAACSAMREGELLGVCWEHVQGDEKDKPRAIALPAWLTKTNESRTVPLSTRLQAIMEMRRLDPKGEPLPLTAHVFGNEVGEQVLSIRTEWDLTTERARISNLHFHDLRREFGCRLLEAGASLNAVRDFLGHTNVTTTNTYLSTTPVHLQDALRKLEDSRRIRTSFAQTGDSSTPTPPKSEAPIDAKSLN
jgi:integrase